MPTTYTPITEIELTNFMSIAHAVIPVGQIVSLCGYNDQGKSAVRTALEVLLYDAYATEQVRLIKDGTDSFTVTLRFADGVETQKEKRIDGTSAWLMTKNGTTLYTNVRSDGTVVAVEDVPECVSRYFGVYYDENTHQELNIRKDRDPYFLVDSSGGDNFKLLNPLFHSAALARASELLLKDSNVCKTEHDTAAVRLSVVQEQLEMKTVVPEELLDDLDDSIAKTQRCVEQQEAVEKLQSAYVYSKSFVVPPQVETVNCTKLDMLERIVDAQQTVKAPIPPETPTVDTTRIDLLKRICDTKQHITPVYAAVPQIDLVRIDMLKRLIAVSEQVVQSQQQTAQIDAESAATQTELRNLTAQLAQYGYKVCKRCGSLVE